MYEDRGALGSDRRREPGYAWLSIHDHGGLPGKEAGEASAWAISSPHPEAVVLAIARLLGLEPPLRAMAITMAGR